MKWFVAVAVAVVLAGCASTKTRLAVEQTEGVGQAYGQVVDVYDADNRNVRSLCKAPSEDQAFKHICGHLQDYDVAKVVIMRVNRFITWQVPVAKSERVARDSFLEFSPVRKMASFRRVVAKAPTETCKWEGPVTYQLANSATGAAAGLVGGMLLVPSAVLASDDALAGGVVCEGWSYKSLIGKHQEEAVAASS